MLNQKKLQGEAIIIKPAPDMLLFMQNYVTLGVMTKQIQIRTKGITNVMLKIHWWKQYFLT